eukprot:COSAG05_NODE_1442_length_4879_cov_8.264644_4_plen_54_part_00
MRALIYVCKYQSCMYVFKWRINCTRTHTYRVDRAACEDLEHNDRLLPYDFEFF